VSHLHRTARGALLLLLTACGAASGESRSADTTVPRAPLPAMTAAALRAVGTTATLQEPVEVAVFAWRDLMPTSGANGGGLIVSAQVRGGVTTPATLKCEGMYLVHGDTVHAARPAEVRAGDGPGAVECIVRGAPAWPGQGTINVIVVVASSGGQRTLIRRETTIEEVH
jgi:hypothetical protein